MSCRGTSSGASGRRCSAGSPSAAPPAAAPCGRRCQTASTASTPPRCTGSSVAAPASAHPAVSVPSACMHATAVQAATDTHAQDTVRRACGRARVTSVVPRMLSCTACATEPPGRPGTEAVQFTSRHACAGSSPPCMPVTHGASLWKNTVSPSGGTCRRRACGCTASDACIHSHTSVAARCYWAELLGGVIVRGCDNGVGLLTATRRWGACSGAGPRGPLWLRTRCLHGDAHRGPRVCNVPQSPAVLRVLALHAQLLQVHSPGTHSHDANMMQTHGRGCLPTGRHRGDEGDNKQQRYAAVRVVPGHPAQTQSFCATPGASWQLPVW